MIENFRIATEEEISSVKDNSDLGPHTAVLALPNKADTPDLVVLRQCWEADPIHFAPSTSNSRKVMLLILLEHILKFGPAQTDRFYFNVHQSDEQWIKVLDNLGAERTSTEPEYRYRKLIK